MGLSPNYITSTFQWTETTSTYPETFKDENHSVILFLLPITPRGRYYHKRPHWRGTHRAREAGNVPRATQVGKMDLSLGHVDPGAQQPLSGRTEEQPPQHHTRDPHLSMRLILACRALTPRYTSRPFVILLVRISVLFKETNT